ncbi:Hypothetical predicted protein [Olea europaea subsp. europaea]|uniref:Uncharacterized protein n=1 Tax=Olea europaea subsp. europaea TaxID=158383 RepID=A0A8S0PXL8_OLEEU|nr:Hypothetical predicted protein [Olea europaea subsp. europaea]
MSKIHIMIKVPRSGEPEPKQSDGNPSSVEEGLHSSTTTLMLAGSLDGLPRVAVDSARLFELYAYAHDVECYQFMSTRPWGKVNDFYSNMVKMLHATARIVWKGDTWRKDRRAQDIEEAINCAAPGKIRMVSVTKWSTNGVLCLPCTSSRVLLPCAEKKDGTCVKMMCIELVAYRLLRKMVRVLEQPQLGKQQLLAPKCMHC